MSTDSLNLAISSFLYNLRESGVKSVYSAACSVSDSFNMTYNDAKRVVLEWNEEVKKGEDPAEGPSNCFKA